MEILDSALLLVAISCTEWDRSAYQRWGENYMEAQGADRTGNTGTIPELRLRTLIE